MTGAMTGETTDGPRDGCQRGVKWLAMTAHGLSIIRLFPDRGEA